jgi:hypothetical protein
VISVSKIEYDLQLSFRFKSKIRVYKGNSNGIDFGTIKGTGYGIGLQQVKDTLKTIKTMNAQMLIKSEENVDTEFVFIFPTEMPRCFADKNRIAQRRYSCYN